jgi:hypothetical protein
MTRGSLIIRWAVSTKLHLSQTVHGIKRERERERERETQDTGAMFFTGARLRTISVNSTCQTAPKIVTYYGKHCSK